jgi:hypothetical protein
MPLLTRGLAQTLGIATDEAQAFAFLYGMLPSAPTVVVFAREFGQPSHGEYLASVQFVGLILTVTRKHQPLPTPCTACDLAPLD